MTQPFNKALVVDDSRMARMTLTKLLNKRGIEVDTAESGTEAVAYIDANPAPDVVFMDYTMPDLDGLETVRRIRDRHGDVAPVAMYTGQDEADDRERARQIGISAFLTKPASDERLGEILEEFAEPASPEPAMASTPTSDHAEATSAATPATELETPEPGDEAGHAAAVAMDTTTDDPERPERGMPEATTTATMEGSAPAPGNDAEGVAIGEPDEAPAVAMDGGPPGDDAVEPVTTAPEPPAEHGPSEDAEQPPNAAAAPDGETARIAAEEAAINAAEEKAREIAEAVAREVATPIAREVGTAAAKETMDKIREDVKRQMKELLKSEAFSRRVTDVFVRTAWPSVRAQITGEVTESLRDEVRHIARQAAVADGGRPVEEATRQAKHMVNERSNELRKVLDRNVAKSVEEMEARLKRLILAVGGGLGAVMLLGFGYLFLFG